MKISKSMIAAGVITTVAVGSLAGTSLASAHTNSYDSSIVDKIAEKFSLNSEDVQAVFDEARDEHHQEMEANRAEHIASLVENGTLTQEQADALKAKHDEMEAARESLQNEGLTREEIHNKMKELRTEFETWAKEQGIDLEAIRPKSDVLEGKGHRGMHMHMNMKGADKEE